MSLPTFRC